MSEYSDHLVVLDSVERRAEIDEKESGPVARFFKALEEGVEEVYHSILSPFSLIGQLMRVQLWSNNWEDDVKNQLFKEEHQ